MRRKPKLQWGNNKWVNIGKQIHVDNINWNFLYVSIYHWQNMLAAINTLVECWVLSKIREAGAAKSTSEIVSRGRPTKTYIKKIHKINWITKRAWTLQWFSKNNKGKKEAIIKRPSPTNDLRSWLSSFCLSNFVQTQRIGNSSR